MIVSLRHSPEKTGVTLALMVLALATIWAGREHTGLIARLESNPVRVDLFGPDYQAGVVAATRATAAQWPKPSPQSGGHGWVYEVFTPPVIYYSPLAGTFTVMPPETAAGAYGFELLTVELEPYRLQLAGYYGNPDELVGAFTSRQLAAPLLGRNGRHFPELGLTLRNLEVRKVPVNPGGPVPAFEVAAIATLFDERAGTEVTLDSRTRKLTDTPLARLRFANEKQPRELREGEEFSDASATYRIEHVQLDPPEVVISRRVANLLQPETKVLRPVGPTAGTVPPKKHVAPAKRDMTVIK